ncbi:unnamed protein product [Arabidopsis thaliana]|uniref:Prolamin-like domain-containing protein n=2 Tax=Arabidopsis thaliana TaxID=3702 RepID=A0A654GCX6_ARATH|nr:ECA1 gametogenesis related family protein [Arabidopsis thaliana]AED97404.1 ECA1 gametogenesis related family protein [Arabidopsis thaliana]VYS71026.1 unnamed protein product [Arabidopsis thaliana]|eukprot:NP_001078778.1 ECA1 gametogenesis related family protein [Arabidopsis thaliana]
MSIKNVISLLMVICIIVSVNARPPFSSIFTDPYPLLNSFPVFSRIFKCYSSVMKFPICVIETTQSVSNRRWVISPYCCKAYLHTRDYCLPKIPYMPHFPSFIRNHCLKVVRK